MPYFLLCYRNNRMVLTQGPMFSVCSAPDAAAAARYLVDSKPHLWALHKLNDQGIALWGQSYSNFAESENSKLREARARSPWQFIHGIVLHLAEQRTERYKEAQQWFDTGSIVSKDCMARYKNQVRLVWIFCSPHASFQLEAAVSNRG